MYWRKCWFEYGKFAMGLALLLTLVVCGLDYLEISLRHALVRHDFAEPNIALVILGGWIAAVFMGSAGSIASEFDGKTSELLFSHPRRRRSLLWTNWLVGILAIECTLLVALLVSDLYCLISAHTTFGLRPFAILLVASPTNVLTFGVSMLGGILLRSASRGTVVAAVVFGTYVTIDAVLRNHFGFDTPAWWFDKLLGHGGFDGLNRLTLKMLSLWMLISLIPPLAAQKVLEHRDVT